MTNLKEKVYEKMKMLCTFKEQIIYENHQESKENDIEIYTVIVKLAIGNRFRIYKGTKYGNSINIEYFTLEEDIIKAIMGEVASNE